MCIAFWVPLLVALIFASTALGIIALFFQQKLDFKLKILIPSVVFVLILIIGYFYYCFCAHLRKRNFLMRHAHGNFKRIMIVIKHRATEFNQLDLEQRMVILATALAPMKELLIADKNWDRRGKTTILNFIQCCKHEIKDMLKDLNLEEMQKTTKKVCDEEIENTIYVNAREGVIEL